MDFSKEYATFKNKIVYAKTMHELQLLEKSLDNLFVNGIFSPKQFCELDLILSDKIVIQYTVKN